MQTQASGPGRWVILSTAPDSERHLRIAFFDGPADSTHYGWMTVGVHGWYPWVGPMADPMPTYAVDPMYHGVDENPHAVIWSTPFDPDSNADHLTFLPHLDGISDVDLEGFDDLEQMKTTICESITVESLEGNCDMF